VLVNTVSYLMLSTLVDSFAFSLAMNESF